MSVRGDLPGPGEPETWPPYTGHPNDPRAGADPLEDCEEIEPNLTRCPVCGGCGWHGKATVRGRLHVLSPLESSRSQVVLRDLENRVIVRDAAIDMEIDHGMEVCPCCEGGEHPDARCRCGRPAMVSGGELTGMCEDHYEEKLREDAAEARIEQLEERRR